MSSEVKVSDFFKNKKNILELKKQVKGKTGIEEVIETLENAVRKETHGVKKAAVLFSGGLDSGLMARLVSTHVQKTVLFSAGTKTSHVHRHAGMAAHELCLPLKFQLITRKEIQHYVPTVQRIIGTTDFLQTQIALAEYLAMKAIKVAGFTEVYCGQGADELFAGYDEFRKVLKAKGKKGVQELGWKKLENLWGENLKRDLAIACALGLNLHAPYLDKIFIEKAMGVPVHDKIHSEHDVKRKHMLRTIALWYGVPVSIALQRKKAIQYDSGVNQELKKLGK